MTLTTLLRILIGTAACWGLTCFAQDPDKAKKPLPDTKEELEAYLIGTSWVPDNDLNRSHVFRKDPKTKRRVFQARGLKPTYVVTGRRTVIITWARKTVVNCVISEDCSKMSETNAGKFTWIRQ